MLITFYKYIYANRNMGVHSIIKIKAMTTKNEIIELIGGRKYLTSIGARVTATQTGVIINLKNSPKGITKVSVLNSLSYPGKFNIEFTTKSMTASMNGIQSEMIQFVFKNNTGL